MDMHTKVRLLPAARCLPPGEGEAAAAGVLGGRWPECRWARMCKEARGVAGSVQRGTHAWNRWALAGTRGLASPWRRVRQRRGQHPVLFPPISVQIYA